MVKTFALSALAPYACPHVLNPQVALWHLGNSMTLVFGPAVLFLTINLADLYSPISVLLDDGASGAPLRGGLYLQQEDPRVPALRDMKARLSKNPRALGRLFLLMQELACRFILGIDDVRCGRHCVQPLAVLGGGREDSNCASGGPSLVGFPSAALAPMESQGRVMVPHAHMKVHAALGLRLRSLRVLFQENAAELQRKLDAFTGALVEAAVSVQYDSAIEAGSQLCVALPPAPFSAVQQRQSRLDGGTEEDGTTRGFLQQTPPDVPGHLLRHMMEPPAPTSAGELRRDELPLTGHENSMLPKYRLLCRTFRNKPAQPGGAAQPADGPSGGAAQPADGPAGAHAPMVLNSAGEVLYWRCPDGRAATAGDLLADAADYAEAYAKDARRLHVRNHTHECSATCLKNQKKKTNDFISENLKKHKAPTCRFWFFHIVSILLTANGRSQHKRIRRRGARFPGKPPLPHLKQC